MLEKILHPQTAKKLESVGINSLYKLITTLPFKLEIVEPISFVPNEDIIYIANGQLISLETKASHSVIKVFIQNKILTCFLFQISPYTLKQLVINTNYQWLVGFKKGFWNIIKFAPVSEIQSNLNLVLGKAELKKYIVPKYNKVGILQGGYFEIIFAKLNPKFFVLNLEGLIPPNQIIPQELNLLALHRPTSQADFEKTQKQWLAYNFFLKICLFRFIDGKELSGVGKSTNLDINYLKSLASSLPFELSASQKTAVWDILQELKAPLKP
jgi:RecG-like helicase